MTETTTWYEIEGWSNLKLREHQVVSRTAKSIIIRTPSWSKEGTFSDSRRMLDGNFFPTKKEALAEVLKRLERKVESAEHSLQYAQKELKKFKESLNAESTA